MNDQSFLLAGDRKPSAPPLGSRLQSGPSPSEDVSLDDISDITITLMTLRKPTELRKIIDLVPKPVRAVPKNGLPFWYRMGLECKLPVPKMPVGKIIFARGKIGEDVSITSTNLYNFTSK